MRSDPSHPQAPTRSAALFDSAPCGIVFVAVDGRIADVNARALRDFGYTREELIGAPIEILVPEADRAKHAGERATFQGDAHRAMGVGRHLPARRKDGSIFPAEIGLGRADDGSIAAFIVDVTEREQTRRALKEGEERFRVLVEHAPEAILLVDPSTFEFVHANPNALELLGYSYDELRRRRAGDLSPPTQPDGDPSAAKVMEKIRAAVVDDVAPFEWVFLNASGDEVLSEVSLCRLPSTRGVLVRASIVDVRARASAERRYRALFESASDAVLLVDETGRILDANPGASHLLGHPTREILERRVADFLHPDASDDQRRWPEIALREKEARVEAMPLRRADGGRVVTDLTARVTVLDARRVLCVVLRDVTARNELQAQLRASDRMASLGLLAAGLAHEINNPLAVVIAGLETLGEAAADVDLGDDAREALADSVQAAERIRAVVSDLRIFSRRDEGTERRPVDVRRVLESSLRMAKNEIRHRAHVVLDVRDGLPLVLGSEARVGQVFLNLLVNAAHAIPEGRAMDNEIRVNASVGDDARVIVEVIDSGCGMSPEVLQHVFEPFFTTKPAGVGTGLGLSICRRIVESMGGSIQVDSAAGRGTRFCVSLPTTTDPRAPERTSSSPLAKPRRSTRLLVIDDDASIGRSVERLLTPRYEVRTIVDPRDALSDLASGGRYDAILCDLMMPQMSGVELVEALARVAPAMARRVVFLTGGAFTPRAQAFLAEAPRRVLEKPFTFSELVGAVEDCLLTAQ